MQAAEERGRLLMICHVLRYTAFFSALHQILASGRLGRIITVEHRENVAYWHMAHSFVRGNWRNSQVESPMILAKCCHDMDILYWNLGPVRRLSSFGSLSHYRPENAPPGAPERCTDGCPAADECPWYAPRLYLHGHTGWPVSVISEDLSQEARRRALETGPYGRCVYHCDNDVVDHQTVNLEFESGASGTLFMHGHSHEEGRTMRYDGTRATLRGRFGYGFGDSIEIHDHLTGRVEEHRSVDRRDAGERQRSRRRGCGPDGCFCADPAARAGWCRGADHQPRVFGEPPDGLCGRGGAGGGRHRDRWKSSGDGRRIWGRLDTDLRGLVTRRGRHASAMVAVQRRLAEIA